MFKTRTLRHLAWVVVAFPLFFGFIARVGAQTCRGLTMNNQRAQDGSAWDLEKVQQEMRNPIHRKDLILVTAHRGDWDICPENTIEGAMVAMDQKLELIELDVRVTTDGIPYLTHDWDLRGEALNSDRARATENNIYKLDSQTLSGQNRVKPDRHGRPGIANDKTIHLQSFRQFLEIYYDRVRRIPDGLKDGVMRRGASIVVDIKGEDRVVNQFEYRQSLQYAALKTILREVRNFETEKRVSLANVLIYKVNLKSMRKITDAPVPTPEPVMAAEFKEFLRGAEIPYDPGLIFIIFPEDWNKDGTKTYERYQPWLMDYRKNYGKLLAVDWQTRYPDINLEPESRLDVDEDRGVGAFVSYNPFPEGGRRSDGTCTYQGDYINQPNRGSVCLQQGLKTYASASIEFFFPPKDLDRPLMATSITTDMYQNAVNYLTITDRRHTEYIQWDGSVEKQGLLGLAPGKKTIDLRYLSNPDCHVLDATSDKCFQLPNNVAVSTDVGGFSVKTSAQLSTAAIVKLNEDDMKTGFTVAIDLPGKIAENVPRIFTVLTILDSNQKPAFSVLRGREGSWYVGKSIDRGSPRSFDTQLWDPVSPCYLPSGSRRRPCTYEMVYLSVRPTGEVRIDDFGLYGQKTDKVFGDWQSTLLNYGIPVKKYQAGVPEGGDYPNQPTLNPDFIELSAAALGTLPSDWYGAESRYKNQGDIPFGSLTVSRFAMWRGGMIGGVPDNQTSLFRGVEQAILKDMQARFTSYKFSDKWLPCNSGQYEVNKENETLNGPTTQYDPKDIATPCSPDGKPVPVPPMQQTGGSVGEDESPE